MANDIRTGIRWFQVVMGLAFVGMMAFPFLCHERGGCTLASVTPWSSLGWAPKAAIAIFVTAGLTLILQGFRLQAMSRVLAIVLVLLFGVLLNAVVFGLRAPACAPLIGAMRTVAEVAAYPECALWPTLTALWIDAFFIGFALEIVRKEFLPEALGERFKKWTQGLLLFSLAPMLILLLALLLPTIGGEVLKERWRRWRQQ